MKNKQFNSTLSLSSRKIRTSLILMFLSILYAAGQTTLSMPRHLPPVEQWIETHFAENKIPPFSFHLDGEASGSFIKQWEYTAEKQPAGEPGVVKYKFTYTHPANKLTVTCTVKGYPLYHAVEWVLHFTNENTADSPIIENVNACNLSLQYPAKGNFNLHYSEGSHITRYDFHPRSVRLIQGEAKQMSPEGGRSSQGNYLPFFNIESPAGQGVVLSVGWTGTWQATLKAENENTVTLTAGMKRMQTFLYPGETIRTPSISLLFWEGKDRMDGHNQFRRFVLAHNTRKINGNPARYPLSGGFNYRDPAPCGEYSCITADYAIAMVKRYIQFGLKPEVFWLDAGWHTDASDFEHGKSWATTTGNWTVDTLRFPEGLRPVADVIHQAGAKFMVWFEPERVVKGTQWAVEFPEWMLEKPLQGDPNREDNTWLLFDLGNPEACRWLSEYIGDMLEENGIDYYRQDCNIEPALYWEANDEPVRTGMKEIRYVEGLYRFWDYLLERFPNLLIDNCASGGRRIDWETTGRSAPLWRSDYYHHYDTDGLQSQTYGLELFLPIHGTGSLHTDRYSFRSSMSSALIYNWKVTDPQASIPEMQSCLKEFHAVRPYYYEDYYPLTGTGDITRSDIWLAYQLHRPSDDSGIVVAFRRPQSGEKEINVSLRGISTRKEYEITNPDTGETIRLTGKELAEKMTLRLEQPRSSLLLKYKPVNTIQK
ncbi:glycoside hydrolase family 36 protein [Parabacteroides pacaensis]|uniref:glycoside hydrolase family 36 protein n=1 Tax=Parabacteroides pacaensis TaxID=2086575 RepID=UPI000D0E7216|nr:glycoside hydrolase family 36 protein [Parabacteroides pacaensis]